MKYIEIKAPAKINIGLRVLGKRTDGYHNIYTLFYPINDLFDTITFELSNTFSFESNIKITEQLEDNLIVKTKNLLESYTGKKINVKINLIKRIPIGGGLGGGSSDAAATLISLNELYKLQLDEKKLYELALMLGSDVPFFIKAKPAIGSSRGEVLEFVNVFIDLPILIINPKIHISTKDAYENILALPTNFKYNEIINGELFIYSIMKEKVINDFEKIIFEKFPLLKEIKKKLYELGALYASMSGTGSTIFGIFNNIEDAKTAKEYFPQDYFCWLSNPLD